MVYSQFWANSRRRRTLSARFASCAVTGTGRVRAKVRTAPNAVRSDMRTPCERVSRRRSYPRFYKDANERFRDTPRGEVATHAAGVRRPGRAPDHRRGGELRSLRAAQRAEPAARRRRAVRHLRSRARGLARGAGGRPPTTHRPHTAALGRAPGRGAGTVERHFTP